MQKAISTFSKVINYSFSQIRVKNNYSGQRNKDSQNIQINHRIVDSREIPDLLKLHEQQHEMFNFVNYATLYKKITQISRDGVENNNLIQINSGLYRKLLNHQEQNSSENISRAIAQLGFYFTKLLESQHYRNSHLNQQQQTSSNEENTKYESEIEEIQKILDEQGVKLFRLMNDQEKSNFLYQLGKRGKVELISKIASEVELVIQPNIELKTLLSIFYSLTISGFQQNEIILKIDKILTQLLSKYEAINYLSGRDLSDILFCYSKNQDLLGDSQIFSLIEEAAALPLSQNAMDNQALQKRGVGYNNKYNNYQNSQQNQTTGNWLSKHNGKERKLASLFRSEIEIDTLSISSMFNSIANFTINKFSYDFYERFENMIILLRFKNTRQLANTFRGIALYYTPSEPFFVHIEKQAFSFLQKGLFEKDLMSFSTILYFMALHGKGSLNFYQSAEKFTIKHLKSFNNRQLNFIFFSFKFSPHYHLDRTSKDQIIDYIITVFPQFTPDEMASIIINFNEFEDDLEKREQFYDTVIKIIEQSKFEENSIDNKLSFSFFWSVFTAYKNYNPSLDIDKMFPQLVLKFSEYLEINLSTKQSIKNEKTISQQHVEELIEIFIKNKEINHKLKNLSV